MVGVLGLDERAELAVGAQLGAGPQVGERPDGGAVADDATDEPCVRTTDGAVADGDVGQRGVGADLAARADARWCRAAACPARMTVSRPTVTSTSIHVVAGSMTVTPAR